MFRAMMLQKQAGWWAVMLVLLLVAQHVEF